MVESHPGRNELQVSRATLLANRTRQRRPHLHSAKAVFCGGLVTMLRTGGETEEASGAAEAAPEGVAPLSMPALGDASHGGSSIALDYPAASILDLIEDDSNGGMAADAKAQQQEEHYDGSVMWPPTPPVQAPPPTQDYTAEHHTASPNESGCAPASSAEGDAYANGAAVASTPATGMSRTDVEALLSADSISGLLALAQGPPTPVGPPPPTPTPVFTPGSRAQPQMSAPYSSTVPYTCDSAYPLSALPAYTSAMRWESTTWPPAGSPTSVTSPRPSNSFTQTQWSASTPQMPGLMTELPGRSAAGSADGHPSLSPYGDYDEYDRSRPPGASNKRTRIERPWQPDEDALLDEAINKLGNKWKTIAEQYFNGTRTQHMCRNRFYRRGKEGSGTNKCGLCGEPTKGHTCRMKAGGALNVPMTTHHAAAWALTAHAPPPF